MAGQNGGLWALGVSLTATPRKMVEEINSSNASASSATGAPVILMSAPAAPGPVSVDMAGLWHREVALVGAYAYGMEQLDGKKRRTFDIAFEVVARAGLGRLVSATYPIERFEEAIAHAGDAGRRGAVKIAFDLRDRRKENWRRPDAGKGPR